MSETKWFPEPVMWRATFSVTNQERKYIPAHRRLRTTLLVGPFYFEMSALSAARREVERTSTPDRVLRLDGVEPVLRTEEEDKCSTQQDIPTNRP